MTTDASTPEPSASPATPPVRPPFLRRLRLGQWLLVLLVAVSGHLCWGQFRVWWGTSEAEKLGWVVTSDGPSTRLGTDWRNIFNKETWRASKRKVHVNVWYDRQREDYLQILRCIEPQRLFIKDGGSLRDLSFLTSLGSVRSCSVVRADNLENLDALRSLPHLEVLSLRNCPKLTNVDALKGLTTLRCLDLNNCTGLKAEQVTALKAAMPKTHILGP